MNPESTPYRTVTSSGEKEASQEAADNALESQPRDLTAQLGGVGIISAEHASSAIDRINAKKSTQVSIRRTGILDLLAHSPEPLTVRVINSILRQSSRNGESSPYRNDPFMPTEPWEVDYSEALIRDDLRRFEEHGLVTAHSHGNTRDLNRRYEVMGHNNRSTAYLAAPAVVELFAPADERQDEIPS